MSWLVALVAVACATEPPPSSRAAGSTESPQEKPVVIEEIEETTVGDLDGHRIPMASVTHGPYTLPDGTERTGDICVLVLPNTNGGVFVGAGSVVTVGDSKWEVVKVDNPATGNGNVVLKQVQ